MSGHTIHQHARIWDEEHNLVGIVDPWGIERRLLIPRAVATLPPATEALQGLQLTTTAQNGEPSATYVCHGDGNGAFAWVKLA
jgi:hypothetical protein